MKEKKLYPKASSFRKSLRKAGYDLSTALADIVDNSIFAKAKNIYIYYETDPFKIYIIDDGNGMDEEKFFEALNYAGRDPDEERDEGDLGRFSLGMKTASDSQSKKYTVISKAKNGDFLAGIWDSEHVDKRDDWVLLIPEQKEILKTDHLDKISNSGTIIIWDDLFINDEKLPKEIAVEQMNTNFVAAKEHLGLTFHRYLSKDQDMDINKINIFVNDREIEPIDPFNANNSATQIQDIETINKNVKLQVFTLPHHSMVDKKTYDKYALKDGYLKSQGLYIYREKRLIISGTWLNIARQISLTQLTRVKIDINNKEDESWGISIDKSRAKLPTIVQERVRNLLRTIQAPSVKTYRNKGSRLYETSHFPVWNRIQKQNNQIVYDIDFEHPYISNIITQLSSNDQNKFKNALKFIAASFPQDQYFIDLNDKPKEIINEIDDKLLEETLIFHIKTLKKILNTNDKEEIINHTKNTPPFSGNWEKCNKIINEMKIL